MVYSIDKRIQIIWFYAETNSVQLTQQKFRKHFKVKRAPRRISILKLVDIFLNTGTVHDLSRCGRKKTGGSTSHIDVIRHAVAKSPKRSIRRLSAENKIKRSTCNIILRKDLKKFPYKIQIKQNSKAADMKVRVVCVI